MQVREALERLDLIHDHLTKSEIYRGFRVTSVAVVGVLGLAAAAFQPSLTGLGFVPYWIAVAGVCGSLGMAAAVHSYFYREDDLARRKTHRVMAQFLPCLIAGGAVTAGLARMPDLAVFLPGLWAVIFGLGIVAARPHLPAGIAWVALGYIVAGSILVLRAPTVLEPSPWAVGGVFGAGHLATAVVLWRGTGPEAEEITRE
jgi:hypothetical protein